MNGPILALDLGTKRTGVAISEAGLLATPLATLASTAPHTQTLIQQVLDLIKEHQATTLVVGLPLMEDQSSTRQSSKTSLIIAQLEVALRGLPHPPTLEVANEYHTTTDGLLEFPDTNKDAAAAAVILESYLEQKGTAW